MQGKIGSILTLGLVVLLIAGCHETRDEDPNRLVVITVTPSNQQTNVLPSSVISIRFSEPVDHQSVIGTNQIILVDQANALVPISFSFQGENVIVTPGSPLTLGATYGIAVRPGVRDIYGQNVEAPYAAEFSTGSSVSAIPNWPPFTVAPPGGPGTGAPSGTWTVVAPFNQARAWHTATLLDSGFVLGVGGETATTFNNVERTAELFDPALLTWTYSTSNSGRGMYFPRAGHTATKLTNGKVLVTGGTPDGQAPLSTAEIYNPITDSFTNVPNLMAAPRVFHTATMLPNGNVLLVGGVSGIGNALTCLHDSMEVYDTTSGTFNQTAVGLLPQTVFTFQPGWPPQAGLLPMGRAHHTATLLPDNSVLICGGYTPPYVMVAFTTIDSQMYFADFQAGIGIKGTIQHTAMNLGTSRACHTATRIQSAEAAGLVYIFGGFSNNPYTGTCASGEVFDYQAVAPLGHPNVGKPGCFTMLSSNMLAERRSHTATYINTGLVYNPSTTSSYTTISGLLLIVGGAGHTGRQTNQMTPPYPDIWVENVGCGCSGSPTSELFDPFALGKNPGLPYRGTDQSGFNFFTATSTGLVSPLPQTSVARYNHTATAFQNGKVLIAGGIDCGFCIPMPFDGIPVPSSLLYNP